MSTTNNGPKQPAPHSASQQHPPLNAATQERLEEFKASPFHAMARVVQMMQVNTGLRSDVDPELNQVLREARQAALLAGEAERARQKSPGGAQTPGRRDLAGSLLVQRNRSSARRAAASRSWAPSEAERAALLAGEHLAHDLLGSGMPHTLAGQHDAIAHFADPIFKTYEVRHLERRGVHVAEAAARHYINHCQPAGDFDFVRSDHLLAWYAEQRYLATDSHTDADAGDSFEGDERDPVLWRILDRSRLVWASREGIDRGVMLDRFHHTHERGVIEMDSWALGKVTEDLASLDTLLRASHPAVPTLPGPPTLPGLPVSREGAAQGANLGVRVHAHRAPHVGIHFLPDYATPGAAPVPGNRHRIGGCAHCAPTSTLPNAPARRWPLLPDTSYQSPSGPSVGMGGEQA